MEKIDDHNSHSSMEDIHIHCNRGTDRPRGEVLGRSEDLSWALRIHGLYSENQDRRKMLGSRIACEKDWSLGGTEDVLKMASGLPWWMGM